jgi:hypothetical protein
LHRDGSGDQLNQWPPVEMPADDHADPKYHEGDQDNDHAAIPEPTTWAPVSIMRFGIRDTQRLTSGWHFVNEYTGSLHKEGEDKSVQVSSLVRSLSVIPGYISCLNWKLARFVLFSIMGFTESIYHEMYRHKILNISPGKTDTETEGFYRRWVDWPVESSAITGGSIPAYCLFALLSIASRLALNSVPGDHSGNLVVLATLYPTVNSNWVSSTAPLKSQSGFISSEGLW